MRLLSLGTDRKLFEEGSAVRLRQRAYTEVLGEVQVIVGSCGDEKEIHEENLHVYSTHSSSRFLYWLGMIRIGRTHQLPDVITVQDPFETGMAGLLLSWWLKVPLHVQVHTDPFAPGFVQASILNKLRTVCARIVLARATRVRVVSERVQESVSRMTHAPVTVLPIFVDITAFEGLVRTKHPRFKISLLCVGRFEKEKRFDRAIEALAAARAQGHDAGLTLVGGGSEEATLRALVRTKGLEQYCIFVSWTSDIRPYLSVADALLVTSDYEGYGLVMIEALSAGVPVIARDVGVAREAGALVVQGDFAHGVLTWIQKGSQQGTLALTLPRTFDEYVESWADDIHTCVTVKNN